LIFFVPRLSALRRKGILEYGLLGQLHSLEFHEKWILRRSGHEAEFLQAPESSTLADYGQSYEKIEGLNPLPAGKQDLIPLALAIAIPAFPVIIAQIPVAIVLAQRLPVILPVDTALRTTARRLPRYVWYWEGTTSLLP
jgi:hypothetical protein